MMGSGKSSTGKTLSLILDWDFVDIDNDLASEKTPTSGRHPLPNIEVIVNKLSKWGVSGDTQAVIYDDAGGAFASRMWWIMRWLGHDNVAVLDGGIGSFISMGHKLTSDHSQIVPSNFVPSTAAEMHVDVEEVEGDDRRAHDDDEGDVEPLGRGLLVVELAARLGPRHVRVDVRALVVQAVQILPEELDGLALRGTILLEGHYRVHVVVGTADVCDRSRPLRNGVLLGQSDVDDDGAGRGTALNGRIETSIIEVLITIS